MASGSLALTVRVGDVDTPVAPLAGETNVGELGAASIISLTWVMGEAVRPDPGELCKKMVGESIFDQIEGVQRRARAPLVELPVAHRIRSFVEVDQVLTEKAALEESQRCLSCGLT